MLEDKNNATKDQYTKQAIIARRRQTAEKPSTTGEVFQLLAYFTRTAALYENMATTSILPPSTCLSGGSVPALSQCPPTTLAVGKEA